jgi:hypothetical protein
MQYISDSVRIIRCGVECSALTVRQMFHQVGSNELDRSFFGEQICVIRELALLFLQLKDSSVNQIVEGVAVEHTNWHVLDSLVVLFLNVSQQFIEHFNIVTGLHALGEVLALFLLFFLLVGVPVDFFLKQTSVVFGTFIFSFSAHWFDFA